jgi:hypothetical protein
MPYSRRAHVPGGTYFFTTNTYRRQAFLTDPNVRSALREAVGTLRLIHPFANELARTRALRSLDRYGKTHQVLALQRKAISKLAHKTNHIERFNNTLRQRVARLVREALSFSKKLTHHIGAIKMFVCHYNLTRAAA